MQIFVGILLLAAVAAARMVAEEPSGFNYHQKFGFAQAARIKAAEESTSVRIVGGEAAKLGDFPYQAGLLLFIDGRTSMCGATLVSSSRLLTAAHCWYDGIKQATSLEVVLGSIQLFHGGQRIQTSDVETHGDFNPRQLRNDIAVIRVPEVTLDVNVKPIGVPFGLPDATFDGFGGLISGYGRTKDGAAITTNAYLSYARVNIVSQSRCRSAFPLHVTPSNVCISGADATSTCNGDSGSPLTIDYYGNPNKKVLVGIASFFSGEGCELGHPAVFVRVATFLPWIKERL